MAANQPQKYEVPTGVGRTAVGVAAARAEESCRGDRLFDDPFAAHFVTAAGAAPSLADHGTIAAQDGDLWSCFASYAPIRTRFFDDYCYEACAAGCRQVVLLAAGLDTRAFRLSWPAGVRLFELDTPEVLAFKEQVLAERAATPTCQRVVISTDLRQDWPTAVAQAGFNPGAPTAWLAEGISMYLTQDEWDRLLDRVGQLSAPESRLGFEYADQATLQHMIDAVDESTDAAFVIKTLWRSDGQEDPTSWLSRNGWQAQDYAATERAQSYGRPMPNFTSPVAQAALAAPGGLITARRVHSSGPHSPGPAGFTAG
jgi:methyltransferase (TIGR00027 family)